MAETPGNKPAAMAVASNPPTPLLVWIFLRLIVPIGPIIIQYSLKALGLYTPPFPQPTFVVLLFSLALVTITEYSDVRALLYGCVVPALGASVLYTVYVLKINSPQEHRSAL